ncbi:hypothetical protein GNY06_08195 [Elizabethkingia argentiflava]|uniref:Uncharacterized protein n=1 Tax=Elizabethkingia argenteiflava TaxID=2681556 RepID=A0A845PT04_9FLAO|nr:hypothetical protein [Elizabethkingia argenteiflava]NAW51362.1 hypothetical protein [Elizabethkingia argenteiflava]
MQERKLIIGKLPLPVGGVTIHVKRLLEHLDLKQEDYQFLPLNLKNLLLLPFILLKYKGLHLHTSSLQVQEYISLLCKVYHKKCIVTFHGDLNRYHARDLIKVKRIIKRISVPIVLNEGSYILAKTINHNTQQISSFIPPAKSETLDISILQHINQLRGKYPSLYATNAYGLTYDKEGQEIYGILDLIQYFNGLNDAALIISDPSGAYSHYLNEQKIRVTQNIYIINKPHSFFEILKHVDANIRNTSTDGDSISVRESLYLSKITFATDVVSRPSGTLIYRRGCYHFNLNNLEVNINAESATIDQLIKIYSTL